MKNNDIKCLVYFLALAIIICTPTYLNAQNTASKNVVSKISKDSIALVKQISKDSLKLLELESQLALKIQNKEKTSLEAQHLADQNSDLAKKLSQNPQDKKLARKADHLSSEVRGSSKEARNAKNELNTLHDDVKFLKDRIIKGKGKLEKFKTSPVASPLTLEH
ncbi:hypothetical protein [Chryseobacterium sp. R2ACT005]|uniref:hypothetical protein n=1 Tax=Chryseobacterium sp. R2ACT005 TaxID=3416668 RepID=UPI003CE74139